MNILNIILLALWFILLTSFLRKFIFTRYFDENGHINWYKRTYIVYKYLPYISILAFITILLKYPIS